jgi:hypothetical protein
MKQLFFILIVFFALVAKVTAGTSPAIIFSQDVVAIDAEGNMLPATVIDPKTIAAMQTHDFDLGRERLLRIETNIQDAEDRGLNDVVATVRRCYSYIETSTGLLLNRGVLLYMIELDEIPYAYSFHASYNDASQWGEVRLALIERGSSLSGKEAMAGLNDFLYDTLPHELGHDVLDGIPQLVHDIDGNASNHTRWFIEGVCEELAKGFSQREVPVLHGNFLSLRNVDTVLSEKQMGADMLTWAQNNENGVVIESNLYGAAMLTMMVWTETVPLKELLKQLRARSEPAYGPDLLAMMQKTTGVDPQEMIKRAHSYGRSLKEKVVLAKLDINKN